MSGLPMVAEEDDMVRGLEAAVAGPIAAAGIALLNGMQAAAAAENTRRVAGWQAYHGARTAGREHALWEALEAAREALAQRDARIAELEDVVAELTDEVGDLHEELADLREAV